MYGRKICVKPAHLRERLHERRTLRLLQLEPGLDLGKIHFSARNALLLRADGGVSRLALLLVSSNTCNKCAPLCICVPFQLM